MKWHLPSHSPSLRSSLESPQAEKSSWRGTAPSYAVVLPADPSVSEQYAAEEMRDWTKRLTGV